MTLEQLGFLTYGPFDLELGRGECVTLTGASGSGKTLLLRAIADLDPHTGCVRLDGATCESFPAPDWRRRVGLLFAESHWWRDSVGEHLHDLELGWLARLGFEPDVLDWEIARLSTGERQRLSLLRLLCNRPTALLIDESTANLDDENTRRVERLVAEYRVEHDAAVLWVTHDAAQAERMGGRRFQLEGGRFVEEVLT